MCICSFVCRLICLFHFPKQKIISIFWFVFCFLSMCTSYGILTDIAYCFGVLTSPQPEHIPKKKIFSHCASEMRFRCPVFFGPIVFVCNVYASGILHRIGCCLCIEHFPDIRMSMCNVHCAYVRSYVCVYVCKCERKLLFDCTIMLPHEHRCVYL